MPHQLANGNVPIQRSMLPEDPEAAVDMTVRKMMDIALGAYGSRSPRIRAAAINIVREAGVREKDYYGEILAIHNWIKKNIRYVKDPVNQETLSHPEELLFNTRAGDCDDMSVLEIALLGALGFKAWPITIGLRPGMYSHVFVRVQVPPGKHRMAGKVIDLDPIMKEWPAGRSAPAHKVKQVKEYRDINHPVRSDSMNGLGDDLGDVYSMLPGIGGYVSAPSYLDDEYSHAQQLLKPDLSKTTNSVANAPKVAASMEGLDGMFSGGIGAEVVEEVGVSTPMENEDSLYQLGPKGPMTARSAAMDTTKLGEPKVRDIDAKVYDVPTLSQALAKSKGRAGTTVVDSRKTIVTIQDKNAASVDQAPKTPEEEAKEIEGLGAVIDSVRGSFLPGIGALADEDVEDIGQKAGIAKWWAERKARWAAARACWAEERAAQVKNPQAQARAANLRERANQQAVEARGRGRSQPEAAVAAKVAAKERANAKAAEAQAIKAGRITHAMARQDPRLAESIAMAQQALTQHEEEASQIDGDLGFSINEMPKSSRPVTWGFGRFGTRRKVEPAASGPTMQQRAATQAVRMPQITQRKMERFCALCNKYRAQHGRRFRQARMRAQNLRHPIAAPIPVAEVNRPEMRGRRYMTRPARGNDDHLTMMRPAQPTTRAPGMDGLGLFNLPTPLLWVGAGAAALYLFSRKRKK